MKNIFTYLLLLPIIAYGQLNRNTLAPEIMPVSPQEFQFMKYGEIPVNKYTGTPDISIPVYMLKTKAFDIPIDLTYHANGNKVNEEAGWVGLGWNLNIDTEIVQTVVGLDDFGYYQRRIMPDYNTLIGIQSGGLTGPSVMSGCSTFFLGFTDDWNQNNPGAAAYLDPRFTDGTYDTQPDIFYFSSLGYSGKFVLDWTTGIFKCLTDKNIKIEAPNYINNNPNPVQEFIITVPDGHTFYYILKDEAIIEKSISRTEFGMVPSNVLLQNQRSSRAFKLWQVKTNKGDLLTLEYEKVKTETASPQIVVSKNLPNISTTHRSYKPNVGSTLNMQGGEIKSYFATSQSYSYLSKIKYNDIELNFITSGRDDLKGTRKLDKIELKHKGLMIKYFTFSYSYFVGNTLGNTWDDLVDDGTYSCEKTATELTHRLKLNSFQCRYNATEAEKPYIFTYNSQSLPKKTSYALDYWGFYNSMHSNISLVPDIYRFNIERDNPRYMRYQGNNNSANLSFTKAWILEKIEYPTGGYTTFDYELNTFGNFVAPPLEQGQSKIISMQATGGSSTQQAVIIKGGSTIFKGSYMFSTRGCNPSNYANTYIKIEKFKPSLIPLVENSQYGLMYALTSLGIATGSNQANYNLYIEDVNYIQMTYNDPIEKIVSDYQLIHGEGIVLFTVKGGCGVYNGTVNSSQASLHLGYKEYLPLSGESMGGGLRIASIWDYSKQGVVVKKKSYQYEGGKLMSPLLYFNSGLEVHEKQLAVGATGTLCPPDMPAIISSAQSQVDEAWRTFSANPSQSTLNIVQLRITMLNNMINDACNIITVMQYFHGLKNELYSGSFVSPFASASGRYVGYDKVTERFEDAYTQNPNDNKGKIVNFYINNPDILASSGSTNGSFTEIGIPAISIIPENGKITREEIRDQNNVLKKYIVNTHTAANEQCLWGMKILTTSSYLDILPMSPIGHTENKYLMGVYPIKTGTSLLTKKEVMHVEDGGELSEITNFIYDTRNQVSKSTWTESNGDTVEKQFSYCYDISTGNVSTSMLQRNFITPVIQTKTIVNGNPVSLIKKPYHYVTGNSGAFILDREMYCNTGLEADLKIITQYSYDNLGNLKGYTKNNGLEVYIIWGYNNMYPVAIIENAPLSLVQTIPGNPQYQIQVASNTGTESELLVALQALRDAPLLADAMITTCTYKPLVGIRTITDPKGERVNFEYDNFGRLISTRNGDSKILSEMEYHYRP